MATSQARQALIWLSTVAVLALGARIARLHGDQSRSAHLAPAADGQAPQPELQSQLEATDSAARRSRPARRRHQNPPTPHPKPQAPSPKPTKTEDTIRTPIDLDRATQSQIEQLPRIGPALAQRIVANRDSLGDFGSIEALQEVRGIGPKMAAAIAPLVTFSGRPRAKHPRIQ